jgi:tRNA/rRNA methyltransferase
VMKNFGFHNLILVNPEEDPFTDTYAQGFACHAKDVLLAAEVISCDPDHEPQIIRQLFGRFDIIIGTSALGSALKNIKRTSMSLIDLDLSASAFSPTTKIALIFGRESTGLSVDQLALTDFIVQIPTDSGYPTLNISQAVGIMLYDIFTKWDPTPDPDKISASNLHKTQLMDLLQELLAQIPLQEHRKNHTFHALKNAFGRALLSRKEQALIFTFFHKINLGFKTPSLLHSLGDFKKEIIPKHEEIHE